MVFLILLDKKERFIQFLNFIRNKPHLLGLNEHFHNAILTKLLRCEGRMILWFHGLRRYMCNVNFFFQFSTLLFFSMGVSLSVLDLSLKLMDIQYDFLTIFLRSFETFNTQFPAIKYIS